MVKDIDNDATDLRGLGAMHQYAYNSGKDAPPHGCLVFQMMLYNDGQGYSCLDFEDREECSVCEACKLLHFLLSSVDLNGS